MQEDLNELCLGELNSILYRQFQIYINNEMKEFGINSSEFMFLVKIKTEPLNQKYISDLLHMDYAIATRSLKSLEKKNLINREKSNEDRREILVSLTEEGEELKNIGLERRRIWKNRIFADLNEKEIEYLMEVIKKMARNSLTIVGK